MKQRLDIVLAVPGLPFNGNTVAKQSLGGSETAGYYLARELASLGHRVTMFTNGEPGVFDDVTYLSLAAFRSYAAFTQHDLCVVQRAPQMFAPRLASKLNWLWCHDLALLRQEQEIKAPLWNVDRVLVVSEFMKKQYQDVYRMPEALLMQTRNGVDLELVSRQLSAPSDFGLNLKHNPKRLVFSARPERGLDVMLECIMPEILKRVPDAKLALCAYDNPVEHLREFYARCQDFSETLGDGVVEQYGALSKAELYTLYHASGAYVYPTPSPMSPNFSEVSCISVMEAMACGLPIVTSDRGALKETIGCPAGKLISGDPRSAEYIREFVDKTVMLLTDPRAHAYASEAGLKRAKSLDWRGVAEQWAEEAERQIRDRSGDRASLAHHFYRHSDIVPLKALLSQMPEDDKSVSTLREVVATEYAFADSPEAFKAHYEKIGAQNDAIGLGSATTEGRYRVLREWLAKRSGDIKTALDFGCAHGAYACQLAKDAPDLRIMGVDIDPHGIGRAERLAKDMGVPDRTLFNVATHDRLPFANYFTGRPLVMDGPGGDIRKGDLFDAVIAQEVLEHAPNPAEVLQRLHERVRPDGWLYITTPFGPWEYETYHTDKPRGHLWEFDVHDWREMLKDFEHVNIAALPDALAPSTGEAVGWWVISYQMTEKNRSLKVQLPNMERKLWLQAPRQSVSLNVMAGPGSEETLHWMLRATEHVADQTVIVDCGLSEEAHRILAQYKRFGLEVIKGPNPKKAGFETPRNLGLEHCWGHWVMWIDTDEKLIQPNAVGKYLRENCFDGYSIRQHHFAVDTSFSPDLPVRLFRRRSGSRWFGMIHEHPERALNEGPGLSVVLPDVHIAHVGYLVESGRQKRFVRNLPMLQEDVAKYPKRLLQKCILMRDNMIRVSYEVKMNGGRVSPQILALAQQTVDLYNQHFLGKSLFMATDPIGYYSQALRILDKGFEVAISLSAGKDEAHPGGVLMARFENLDAYLTELKKRATEQVEPLVHPYY